MEGETKEEHQEFIKAFRNKIRDIQSQIDPEFYEDNDDGIIDIIRDLVTAEMALQKIIDKHPNNVRPESDDGYDYNDDGRGWD